MITVKLNGGLGNQMFQYAIGKVLSIKKNTCLNLDTSNLIKPNSKSTERVFELQVFLIKNYKINLYHSPLILKCLNTISFKLMNKGLQFSNYFVERKISYNQKVNNIRVNCTLIGYWQSYKYFEGFEDIIKSEFSFHKCFSGKNILIASKIEKCNSISIHIRRGDFSNNKNHDIHGTCSIEYYQKAISYIIEKIEKPYFFIFSDDINWVRQNLIIPYMHEYVTGNSGLNSYIDMQLMSVCKHNIIANSSFSWWAAWLNTNNNKIVISPLQWFSVESLNKETVDLIPNTWIRM